MSDTVAKPKRRAAKLLALIHPRWRDPSRCDACGVTYLPARIFCERCFAALGPGVECGPGGGLTAVCLTSEEANPECKLDQPCPAGEDCIDNECI